MKTNKNIQSIIAVLILIISFSLMPGVSFSSYYIWTGSVNSSFGNTANWSAAPSFSSGDTLEIVSATNMPALDSNFTVYNLVMKTGTFDLNEF